MSPVQSGWMDRLGGLCSRGTSFLSPTVSPLMLRVEGGGGGSKWVGLGWGTSDCPVFAKACSRTAGCYEDIIGRRGVRTEVILCFQCGRTLTSSEH